MKEVKYIVHAYLLVSLIAAGFLFFKNFSFVLEDTAYSGDAMIDNVPAPIIKSIGKQLFSDRCASCHIISRDFVAPALCGFEERGPWADRKKLYQWIKNPSGFMNTDPYTQDLKQRYTVMMQAFPDLANEDIDEIVNYIKSACGPVAN